jgi:CRISPR-associated exonuclease Cas4
MNAYDSDKTVSASDMEKFGYCPLSWWLSEQKGKEDARELTKGIESHAKIGEDVKNIKHKEKRSEESERSVLWFSIIAIIIGINGAAIIYTVYSPSSQGESIMIMLSIIAVIWVLVAAVFFYFGKKMEKRTKLQKDKTFGQEDNMNMEDAATRSKGDSDYGKRAKEAKWNTLLFFIVSGILASNGVIILFSIGEGNPDLFSRIFIILSLIWLIGSSFFYYTSLRREITSKEREKSKGAEGYKWSFSDSDISVVLFALVATIFASNSLTIYQDPNTNIGRIILILAILWLYGGFIFIYRAVRANMKLRFLIGEQLKRPMDVYSKIASYLFFRQKLTEAKIDYEKRVIWFAIIAMILAFNAIIMNFTRNLEEDVYGTLIAHIFEVVALLWLIGAFFFLYLVILHSMAASKLRQVHGINEGKIDYVDALDGNTKMLASEKYGLRGRPDYILEKDGEYVPVEVKTGRIPKGPLFSHILQLAAYCLLLEEKNDRPPKYGIIRYSNIQHEIEYTNELKKILLSKLTEMKEIMVTKEAHRNHKRPNKCRGCSRREICPEKLV